MEVDSEVWLKGKESKKNANDGTWTAGQVISKDVDHTGVMTIVVRSAGTDFMFSSRKGGLDLEDVQLKNANTEAGVENLIELPYLNEPEILHSLSTRYFANRIYTYTGNILIAINPLHAIVPDASCEGFLQHFASEIKTLAVGLSDSMTAASDTTPAEVKRHSIIISGESGSGKTECAKLLTMFLISAEVKSSRDFLGVRTVHDAGDTSDEEDGSSSSDGGRGSLSRKLPHTISQDSMLCMTPKGASQPGSSNRSAFSMSTKDPAFAVSPMKSVFFKAYQLSTMERIRQVTPILEAFGNACIAHTQNSSRLGKYAELSFSKRGDLVGGEIRTYLLENVRVIRQLERERNFHIFYQIAAGASTEERNRWAVGEISSFHYANQGGKTAMRNPLVDDVAAFQSVRENFANLGFEEDAVENILQVVAGILHLGQIEFTFTTALEGQVAEVIEKFVSVGDKTETELAAAARLCSFSAEELNRCLTKRTVLLNKESFLKSLTPEQALSARDAVAKAIYKRLFTWLVQELNTKLRPTENMPAAITSSVGILDIFGFDSFAVNSFEQLCINYANEALQQHFSQHMFKLELLEYKREGIPFEDIEFPDNQESLDLITSGVFTILDDQCRIPNPTDKRFASQLYKDLATNEKFSASAPQMSANQFCVQHFAGPVVYATDTFTEKNLDQLPQDAAELLKNSRNPVLAGESATETVLPPVEVSDATAGLPKAPLPVMAAYVSKTKVDPASRLGKPGPSAAPARRGSLGGKGLPSVVAQLRNEVAVMMAHINTTIPHYVCCINPVERMPADSSATALTGKAAQYQPHVVAAQLRYGGILGAVKVARSGLPHRVHFVDFFQRYRSLCNPLNPVSRTILPHLPSTADESLAKVQCELLVESLSNTSGTPVVVSAIQSQLVSEMQVVLRKRSVRQWMGSIGGVINEGGAKVGLTKVFLGKPAHTLLESCLYHQLALCRQKIGDLLVRRINRKRFARTMSTIQLIQRIMRGALARFRRRALLRRKAAGAQEPSAIKESLHVSPPENEVREVKRQDALIQDQIKRLVAGNKVVEEPEGSPSMDFAATKQDLQNYAARFPTTSVLSIKTLETSEAIGEGFELLRPEKLIPLTTVSKALSFGRAGKSGDRSSSVKSANKVVTKDHAMFKNIHKLMDRLRELFELAKLEKEVLDTRKRNKARPGGIISGSGKSTPGGEVDMGDIEIKMATLDKVAKLARSIYQYYHQYILELVKQYGFESRYRTNFGDDNQYLLAFVALVELRKPLLDCEKVKEAPAGDVDGDTSSTKNFPLYIPSERQQGPQHQGYLPLTSTGGVHFKVLPPSHAPGVEYAINSMHRLLKGHALMYPIKYLKIIGKSGDSRGKESFYQAATEFGADNLATIDRATLSGVQVDDFSAMVVVSAIFGVKVMHPQNVMANSAKAFGSEVTLHGVNCDEAFLSHMFRFRASDAAHMEDLNVLYMMPQMDAPVSPTLAALLSKPGAAARLVSTWLRELSMQNKRLAGLKSAGFTPADFATLSLPIVLPTHAGAQVLHMLTKACAVLQEASTTGRVVTHSDLLVALEAALAERYAEQRIHSARNPVLSFMDVHKTCHLERAASIRINPQIKNTFVVDVDHTAAEVLNTLEFNTLPDSPEEQSVYSAIFDNFSFLPALHLRHISESQLRMLFTRLLDWNKQAFVQLSAMRPLKGASPPRQDDKIRPAVRTAVKSVTICGLSQAAAREFAASAIVSQIQQELGVKVNFDVPLSKK